MIYLFVPPKHAKPEVDDVDNNKDESMSSFHNRIDKILVVDIAYMIDYLGLLCVIHLMIRFVRSSYCFIITVELLY